MNGFLLAPPCLFLSRALQLGLCCQFGSTWRFLLQNRDKQKRRGWILSFTTQTGNPHQIFWEQERRKILKNLLKAKRL